MTKHTKDTQTLDPCIDERHAFRPPHASLASRQPTGSQFSFTGTVIGGNPPREIRVESKLERDVALVLLARSDVADLVEQVPVSYVDEAGIRHNHTFDFRVTTTDGTRIAIAVKPEAKAEKAWSLVRSVAEQNAGFADKFLVMTNLHVSRDSVANAAFVAEARRRVDPKMDALLAAMVDGLVGTTTIGSIVEASGHGADMFAAVARALGDGKLVKKGCGRIRDASVVGRAV